MNTQILNKKNKEQIVFFTSLKKIEDMAVPKNQLQMSFQPI